MTSVRFSPPPNELKKAKLDNIVLMPASALPFKRQYQEIANRIPERGVLIVTPLKAAPPSKLLQHTAALLRAKGYLVQLVSLY